MASHQEFFKLGLLGFPLGQSLSPLLHTQFLRTTQQQGFYRLLETPADFLEARLTELQEQGYRGVNVTIPHKVAVIPYLHHLTREAQALQAVNTIYFSEEGERFGDNTDHSGFYQSLPLLIRQSLPSRPALVIGAGGSARAVLWALLQAGVPSVSVLARSSPRSQQTQALLNRWRLEEALPTELNWVTSEEELHDDAWQQFGIVTNTTPLGMWPEVAGCPLMPEKIRLLSPAVYVVDLIYKPFETQLLRCAREAALPTQNGAGMLVHQAMKAFQWWSGKTLPESLANQLIPLLGTSV
jgi:shikimate dehydrogenase